MPEALAIKVIWNAMKHFVIEAFAQCAVSMVFTDNFIRKTKQRYNSPRSLSTKINLADMQTEIKLRPPYQLSAEDIGSINGFSQHNQSKYKGIGKEHTICIHNIYASLFESLNLNV